MPEPDRSPSRFKFIAGELCLDFVNTVANYRDPAQRYDKLVDYADLLAWTEQSGALPTEAIRDLAAASRRHPNAAERVLRDARRLRAALYGITVAIARGATPDERDLARLNEFVGTSLAHSRLEMTDGGIQLAVSPKSASLDAPLWPVVRSAIDLFTTGDLDRVRECDGNACGWVFLDTSRGGRRRWCDMADCGNLAKVRRFRARQTATVRPSQ